MRFIPLCVLFFEWPSSDRPPSPVFLSQSQTIKNSQSARAAKNGRLWWKKRAKRTQLAPHCLSLITWSLCVQVWDNLLLRTFLKHHFQWWSSASLLKMISEWQQTSSAKMHVFYSVLVTFVYINSCNFTSGLSMPVSDCSLVETKTPAGCTQRAAEGGQAA